MHAKIIYNDKCFDDIIPGFHTLDINGRQFPTYELTTRENTELGAELIRRRQTDRVITVNFCMYASNKADMLSKQNQLNSLLGSDIAKLEFDDDPNYYYNAIFQSANLDESVTARSGTLTFMCLDPYKHSTIHRASRAYWDDDAEAWRFDVDNYGNVPAPVRYELTLPSENGYIGISSKYGAMEYGSLEEVTVEAGKRSELLLNLGNGSQIRSAFKAGVNPITTGAFSYNGTLAVEGNWLRLNTAGSGSSWHGAGGQIDIPADSTGERTAKNFRVAFRPFYATHKTYAVTGDMEIVVGDEQGNLLCDVHLAKDNVSNNYANAHMKIAGHGDVFKLQYEPRSDYGITNENGMEVWFGKSEDLFSICWNGQVYQYRFPELKEKKAKTLNVFFGCYGNYSPITYMRLLYLTFAKDNVPYYNKVPNRYKAGDKVVIDGESTMVTVNGLPSLSDEVIGTKYFLVPPGRTEILMSLSQFCNVSHDIPPNFYAYVTEAFK